MKVVSKRDICISYELYLFCQPILFPKKERICIVYKLYLFCQPIIFPKKEKGGIMRHLADSCVNKEKPGGGSGDRITL